MAAKVRGLGFMVALGILGMASGAGAATTYAWNQTGAGAWGTAANWTPARTLPSASDILVFGNGATTTVTAMPTQTIGSLIVSGNTAVTLESAAPANMLTIAGGSGTDLVVEAGSSLTLGGILIARVALAAGATGQISGSFAARDADHRLMAQGVSSLEFLAGSSAAALAGFAGAMFGDGTGPSDTLSVVFRAGSLYAHGAGAPPFGLAAPLSVVTFEPGSLYRYDLTASPSLGGRTYGDFEYNGDGACAGSGAGTLTMGSLSVARGTFNLGMTGTFNLQGDVTVAAGAALNFNPGLGTPAVSLNGPAVQTITAAGTLASTANSVLRVDNAQGVVLATDVNWPGSLDFVNGRLSTGNNLLTLGSSLTGASATTGWVDGRLARAMVPAGGNAARVFDVGDAAGYSPVTVSMHGLSAAFDLAASAATPDHPNLAASTLDTALSVNRYWALSAEGPPAFTSYEASFAYPAGDIDPGADPMVFSVARYSGGVWTPAAVGARALTSTQATGLSGFGEFAIGQSPGAHYTILATAGPGGSIVPSGTVVVDSAGIQTFTITPDPGYSIADVLVDSLSVGTVGEYTFTAVAADHTIEARFATGTYAWNRTGTAAWETAAHWTPARLVPAVTDVLLFNNGATTTVTGMPMQTIGRLVVSGNTAVTLQSPSAVNVLTIAGADGPDLVVEAGASLTLGGDTVTRVALGAGATGQIAGAFSAAGAGHRLMAQDASALEFLAGSTASASAGFTGNVFGDGSGPSGALSVVFRAGSRYVHGAGSPPFALSPPLSVVSFEPGSLYRYDLAAPPSLSGRTYGDFEYNGAGECTGSGSGALTMGDLTVTQGTLDLGMTGTFNLQGDVTVAAGAALDFNPGMGTPAVSLNGPATQTITADGALTSAANCILRVDNANGVALATSVTWPGSLAFVNGQISTGSNVLTIGSGLTGASGATGWVDGNLAFSLVPVGGEASGVFDIGDASAYSPVEVAVHGLAAPLALTVGAATPDHPDLATSTLNPAQTVNRHWSLSAVGAPGFSGYDATFDYAAADVDAGADPQTFSVQRYESGAWTPATVGARTSTSTQATGLTAFGDFAIGEAYYTITASAGPGGSINPSGAVIVAPGADQAFSIAPDPGLQIADVVVDDVPVGAVSEYTFTAVSADHTIEARFGVGLSVAIENVTLTHTDDYVKNGQAVRVTAVIGDGGGAPMQSILADLTGLGGGGAVAPDSYDGGMATWDLAAATCNPADGTVTVSVSVLDLQGHAGSGADTIIADNTAPAPLSGLTAGPGAHSVALSWTSAYNADPTHYYGARIRYRRWTGYPAYAPDPPAYPASAEDGDGTAFDGTGNVASAAHARPLAADRDVYVYSGFVYDIAMNFSPAAPVHDARATSYVLGDVCGAAAGDTLYNGLVDAADVAVLDAAYGLASPTAPLDEMDVGPTDDASGAGVPEPDGTVGFEDLMVAAMNYHLDSPPASPPAGGTVPLHWVRTDETVWALRLDQPYPSLKGLELQLTLPEGASATVTAGPLVTAQAYPHFLGTSGSNGSQAGLALLGPNVGFDGRGELLRVTLSTGAMPSAVAVLARDVNNAALTVNLDQTTDVADVVPAAFRLEGNAPNPFNPVTTIRFALPEARHVRLAVFSLDGRRVATLLDADRPAGVHAVTWNGRDDLDRSVASGTYVVRVEAGPDRQMQKVMLAK